MTIVQWATMWHVVEPDGRTTCNRVIPEGAEWADAPKGFQPWLRCDLCWRLR